MKPDEQKPKKRVVYKTHVFGESLDDYLAKKQYTGRKQFLEAPTDEKSFDDTSARSAASTANSENALLRVKLIDN